MMKRPIMRDYSEKTVNLTKKAGSPHGGLDARSVQPFKDLVFSKYGETG
jgi:malate synthase